MSWTSIVVRTNDETARDNIAGILIGAGAGGVHVRDDQTLVTYLAGDADLVSLGAAIRAADGMAELEWTQLGDVDWTKQWIPKVGVQHLGRICIAPPWLMDECGPDEIVIVIDPAMAFGTGEHPTTRGMLRLLQHVVRPGDVVADLGSGSAVLSIAAAKLGAARVAAVEIDGDAISNAEENVERNGVADRVRVIEGDAQLILPLLAPVRLVFANIVSHILEDLSLTIRSALTPDGAAILSGILVEERESILRWFERDGWVIENPDTDLDEEGEWWSVVVRPR